VIDRLSRRAVRQLVIGYLRPRHPPLDREVLAVRRRLKQSIFVLVGLVALGSGAAAAAAVSKRSRQAPCQRNRRCPTTTTTTAPHKTTTTAPPPTTTTDPPPTTTTAPPPTTTTSGGTIPGCNSVPTNPAPDPQTSQCQFEAYTTGYGWWDNTPPGSSTISYPVIHQTAGGTGTYADPITLAVGHEIVNGEDIPEFPAGTKWYIPNFRRYFIVEDSCGDGNDPQAEACWSLKGDKADGSAPAGAQIWIDLWTGGQNASESTSNNCEDAITDNHLAIMNPASDYAVVSGDIDGASGCTQQYGDSIVSG